MDLLDRLIGHDAWTTRHLLERCREVSAEGLRRPFEVGHGNTLRGTIAHVVRNVELWTHVLCARPPDLAPPPIGEEETIDDLIRRFDIASADFAAIARSIRDEGRWDDTYLDTLDNPPRSLPFGGTILHLATHGMAHRTDILHMLARLGVPDLIEGDALSWELRHRHAEG